MGFCGPDQFITVSILIYKHPETGQNFPKKWFEQTKADPKCPEIGHAMSKNNVQGPKYPLHGAYFGETHTLIYPNLLHSVSLLGQPAP